MAFDSFLSIFSLVQKRVNPFKQQPAFLRLAAISPLCLALNSPAPGLLLSLSLSISHRTGTSAPLLSVSTPTPPFGFIPLPQLGRWAAQSAPTPRTSGISAARLVRTESKVEPAKGYAARFTSTYFRATGDGFLVWGSFPRLVRTGIKVDPEGLPYV